MILRDDDERLILNMRHGTSSYSNKPKKESINMIDIYNVSHDDYLEDLFANEKITNHLSGNPTLISDPIVSSSPTLTSLEESDLIWEEFEAYLRNTTSSSPDHLLEEYANELALITFPPGNDDLPFVELALIESFPSGNDDMTPEDVITEIEYLLNRDPLYSPNKVIFIPFPRCSPMNILLIIHLTQDMMIPMMIFFISRPIMMNGEKYYMMIHLTPRKLKSKFLNSWLMNLIPLDQVVSFLISLSVTRFSEDFSEVDTLTATDNEDKVFNPGILVHENLNEVTNRVTPDKDVKKKSSSNASLILEDYNPPLSDHELPFHIEIPRSGTLLSFSSENEEKVFNPGILIFKGVHSVLPKLSDQDSKAFN
ncbi:hypothetical protein Tco_0740400 [Tanacetum coccineum]